MYDKEVIKEAANLIIIRNYLDMVCHQNIKHIDRSEAATAYKKMVEIDGKIIKLLDMLEV